MKNSPYLLNLKKSFLLSFLVFFSGLSWVSAQPNPNRPDLIKAFSRFPNSVHKTYLAKVFDCDENKKLHAFTLLLTPAGYIQFGSNPKVVGRQNIENMLIAFNKKFKHLSQHIQEVFYDSEKEIVYAADATYSFDNGSKTIPIPYMVHLTFQGDLVTDYKIYIDLAPFYQLAGK